MGVTVCLAMIVRDEAPVVARCLAAVTSLVDAWVIVDTGSTDATLDVIHHALDGLPAHIVSRPWVDFAHNRSEALALARECGCDYTLMIDADDVLMVPVGFAWPALDADSYTIGIEDGGTVYRRTSLFRSALPWTYRGVLHEFPACDDATTSGDLSLVMQRGHDGARRRDPNTYRRDAALLARAAQGETDPLLRTRYAFYLAQSWRDCDEVDRAIRAYLRRALMGGWAEEIYVSLLMAGRLMRRRGDRVEAVRSALDRAQAVCPHRGEALLEIATLHAGVGQHADAYAAAAIGAALPLPADGLFVEPGAYTWGLVDQRSIAAYWTGLYRDSIDDCLTLLGGDALPAAERGRVATNARFAAARLAA